MVLQSRKEKEIAVAIRPQDFVAVQTAPADCTRRQSYSVESGESPASDSSFAVP
jgi:hypothetical protein